jgi:dihydroorotase
MSERREVNIGRPDDMHLHFRQDDRMMAVVPFTALQFGRAIVMPNTVPYIRTVDEAARYRNQIIAAVPSGVDFTPLMTLYLQTTMSPDTIREARRSGFIHGIKMYPAGATTNSEGGVVRVQDIEEQLSVMEEVDMPLLIHGESADPKDDVFRRESIFYGESFAWLTATFPKLRISCEHISTRTAVEMIEQAPSHLRLGATMTPQHLLENRNYLLGGHLRPHAFCKPILKAEEDRQALLRAATSGNPRFFLGTDSAPHPQRGETGKAKECDCGCAGCFSAHAAIELYAEAFDGVGSLDRLDDFASRFGAEFYELPRNDGSVRLVDETWSAEPSYDFGENQVVPFRQEVPLKWRALAE